MIHFHWVGHFDPRDPLDFSVRPWRPKARRPLDHGAVERTLASFPEVADYVHYDEDGGFVGCYWSDAPGKLWDRVHRFARALAEAEGAVVMNEGPMFLIEFPPAARQAQEEFWEGPGK